MRYLGLMFTLLMILAVTSCKQKPAQEYFKEGAQLVQKGELDKGIECYQQGLAKDPKSVVGYNLLGMAYRFKYNQTANPQLRKKEIEAFQQALKINPDYMPVLINLGATYYYSGEKKKAAPYFKHALEVYPSHPEADTIRKMIKEGETEP